MTKLKTINIAILIAIIALGITAFMLYPPEQAPKKSGKMPVMFGMEGLSHADLNDDVMVLNVFASWCTPCRAEHKILMSMSKEHGIPIYGIAFKDTAKGLAAFLDELGDPYKKIGMDYSGIFADAIGATGTPETIIINKDYKIIWRHSAPITQQIMEDEILKIMDLSPSYQTPPKVKPNRD